MRRRHKPSKRSANAARPAARTSPGRGGSTVRALEQRLAAAVEQQTATSEILRVISGSLTDVQPVFDSIVQSAVRLCGGLFSALYRFDGELIHPAAQHNFTPE